MSLSPGQAVPWFVCPTPSNPQFTFSAVAGRYVVLAFLPQEPVARQAALARIEAEKALFDGYKRLLFCVARDPADIARAQDRLGIRWFQDHDGSLSRLCRALTDEGVERPHWCVIDPSLRVLSTGTMDETDEIYALLRALPEPDDHAGVPISAPVLIVPRIFEPELCRTLIEYYARDGGAPSGVMREVGGKTVPVIDNFKSRSDAFITDPDLKREIVRRLETRLMRQINLAFQFRPTRIERYIVACYDAQDGGYFRAHRDNTTTGTAHRQFACSINLNAEEFEGGDLRFSEFGSRTYRPPTGGAVVFSCSLLHEATPVTRGRRYAFLPFFHNEAAEQLRLQNLHSLELPAPPAP
jgi:predicted 2-oxoglutarate/Fe(II)-dependent dioxygenase YbiX